MLLKTYHNQSMGLDQNTRASKHDENRLKIENSLLFNLIKMATQGSKTKKVKTSGEFLLSLYCSIFENLIPYDEAHHQL